MTVAINRPRYLTKEQIKNLSDSGHVIAAHTWDHHMVTKYQGADWDTQLSNPKKQLEAITGKPLKYFAYPFGGIFDVSSKDPDIAQSIGFKTSTLNQAGNIFRSNYKSMHALARMPLGNSTDDQRMNYYLNGIYHFSTNQFNYTIHIH